MPSHWLSKSRPPAASVAGSFPLGRDKKRTAIRHRPLIESCELGRGEFLIAPIPVHRDAETKDLTVCDLPPGAAK